jgi:hypothetical protein
VRILGCTLTDSPIGFGGAAKKNNVTLPGLPWHDGPNLVAGNLIVGRLTEWKGQAIGQGLRTGEWDANLPTPPVRVTSNTFDIAYPGWAIVVQGFLTGDVTFVDNSFSDQWVGTAYRSLPDGRALPDPSQRLKFERNRVGPGSFMAVGTKRITVN